MAQSIQIVPKYSFPYVESVINDYTVVDDSNDGNSTQEEPVVRYIFAFPSSKGIDNHFIKKKTRKSAVTSYGESNWKKYGQPLMQVLDILDQPNTEVWCMRVMPENAAYAHNIISAYFLGDTAGTVPTASERKFRIKFTQKTAGSDILSTDALKAEAAKLDGEGTHGVYTDAEGYTQVPGVVVLRCAGRGKYGNDFRVRLGQDIYYEKDYGIKFYDFEVLNAESGLKKEANFVGSIVTSSKYNETTLINDVLEDQEDGLVPLYIDIDEDGVADVYEAYKAWATALIPDLQAELDTKLTDYAIPDGMVEGLIPVTDTFKEKVAEIRALKEKITTASNCPDLDQFDMIFGRNVAANTSNPLIFYPTKLTDDVNQGAPDYKQADYTQSDIVSFDSASGIRLNGGNNGYFDAPRVETVNVPNQEGEIVQEQKQWTVDDEVELCLNNAYSGVYDKRILTAKRLKANALWDANYPMSVKNTMVDLAMLRNDAICYLDTNIRSSFSDTELAQMIKDYSVFNNYLVDKNIHHYYTRETTSKKRVPVTITYFLSIQYASHVLNYGAHIPFVKDYCQLSGHIKDSLYPTVEDYENDLKETLVTNRFNYFETLDDNVYQRATQNTSQANTSDLLEESNVTTLFTMKRIVEADIQRELYDFTDSDTRSRFKETEKAKFANWSSREVQSFDIRFEMNAWEEERSIIHCYIDVTFRGLQKRGILEVDINKRTNNSSSAAASLSSLTIFE